MTAQSDSKSMARGPRLPSDESFNYLWRFVDKMDRNGLVSLSGSSVEQLTLKINNEPTGKAK